ncbi:MAG: hypothetical protein JWN62_3928 [Acidimicrobiales bacterium]|nr:hypothetical protein [Acidimicrobiales bacterium]
MPGLGDLVTLVVAGLGGSNPLASIGKTIDQFKRGVNDFLVAVENFNATMQTMNAVATRVSSLLDEVEEPIRILVPQVTRSMKMADAMIDQMSGPIEKVAPGIARLAETLGSPVFTAMPTEIGNFLDTIGDVAARLQPLAQIAENAGSLFGLRNLNPFSSAGRTATPPPPPSPTPAPAPAPVAKRPPAQTRAPAAKKAAAAKRPAAKKSAPKR